MLVSGAAFAADAPPAQAHGAASVGDSNTAQAAKDKNAMICRAMPPETGTRMGARRICHTAAEWEAQSRDGQEATRILQQKATMGRPPGG